LVLALFVPLLTQAQLPALPWYEPFAYGVEGEQLGASGTSGTNWTTGNSVSSSSARIVAAAGLTYVGLVSDTNSPARGLRSNNLGKNRGALFTAVSNGTVYASFLLNLQTNPATPRVIFGLSSTTGTGPNGNATVWVDALGQLSIGKVNSATLTYIAGPTMPLTPTNTYLVVLAYKFISGSTTNDEVDLWLDPIPLGNASVIPPPTLITTNGSDAPSLQSVYYLSPTSQGTALFYLDEIRVATDWASVMPLGCLPGTAFNVTGGGFICSGVGVPVGISGSETGVDYWLVTNGVPTGVVVPGAGSVMSFGTQTNQGLYTVFGSNTVTTCAGWMNGTASVANGCPPAIAVQPTALTVPASCTCTFSVSASGGGLAYQWRRNGTNLVEGARYAGTTTPNLTIYPVGSGDVAGASDGYDVVVSGQFGSPATSSRVGLSLGPAHNLTWVGNGTNDLWDIQTTADWALPGGAASVFNFGDNVTFDDMATTYTVNLGSQFLSPGTLMVKAGTYIFAGSGTISGAGTTLIASNTAALTLNVVNRYGGGTVIQSNATVNLQYASSIGSGPVILDGGILHITAPSKSLTFSNNLQIMTDSTLSGVSGSTPNVYGTVTGTAGSLTFSGDSSSSFFSPNLYANFTFNLPIYGNNTTVALTSDSTGQTVFNGPIAGSGLNLQRRGTGVVIFNAPNTYNNTLLSTGGIGFGCDNISTNAPLPNIDAGPIGIGTFIFDDTATAGAQWVFASGGPRLVGNAVSTSSGTNNFTLVVAGTNNLELAGNINMGSGILTVQATNAAVTTLSGGITAGAGLTKTGVGTVVLGGANYYNGPTTVSAGRLQVEGEIYDTTDTKSAAGGTLCGSGILDGPVLIQSTGALSPGQAGLGTLTINNTLTLQGGSTTLFALNKGAHTNGLLSGMSSVTYGGTLAVSNISGTLAVGDAFKLFDASAYSGAFSAISPPIPGAGLAWSNSLATDGTLRIVKGTGPNPTPTNITYMVSSQGLVLSWPADHIGWTLQGQTNAPGRGITTNWVAVPGSSTINSITVPISPANGSVFYRLMLAQ
jgi:autotransporter-associated beta strand protein